jgi:hypothetical protein
MQITVEGFDVYRGVRTEFQFDAILTGDVITTDGVETPIFKILMNEHAIGRESLIIPPKIAAIALRDGVAYIGDLKKY